jgi:hypothetical protein
MGNQAVCQSRRAKVSKGERVGQICYHGYPAGPPRPASTSPKGDRNDIGLGAIGAGLAMGLANGRRRMRR